MDSTKPIEWTIKEIKELEFFVNEFIEPGTMLDTTYKVTIEPIVNEEKIRLLITFYFMKKETKEVIMKSTVMTVYLIRDLKSFATKINNLDNVNLPDPLWYMLFGIAFTHTRAILARSSAGSKYSQLIMPPINPEVEFKKLFGNQQQVVSNQ